MIYLLGQMSFILLLAAIAGVALGWGFHRLRNQQHIAGLRDVISQQQQQVKQATTEVSMLAQDYDDLKQTSTTTIDNLRRENAQIPNLHQNLDKSQLLVRQLMQKHEAQIRAYASENDTLKGKVKHLDDREQALNKLQSDVERGRRELNNARTDASANPKADVSPGSKAKTGSASSTHASTSQASNKTATGEALTDELNSGSNTELKQDLNDTKNTKDSTEKSADPKMSDTAQSNTTQTKTNKINATAGLALDAANTETIQESSARKTRQTIAELTEKARAKVAREKADAQALSIADSADADNDSLDMSADISGEAGSLTIALAEADIVLAAIDKRRAREEELLVEDDEVIDASEFDVGVDDEDELEQLFDPVDQHDDLQTIFGIGPVTERGLNRLGITSYSQLAELKRHDIEKIAGALEIVPGKIERENWVGNARRQLEDVLEEL